MHIDSQFLYTTIASYFDLAQQRINQFQIALAILGGKTRQRAQFVLFSFRIYRIRSKRRPN